jgi:hypothetical protein
MQLAELNHVAENALNRHGMAANPPRAKKSAVTGPIPLVVFDEMWGVVVSFYPNAQRFKFNAVTLFRIDLGLLNLADHPIIHSRITLLFCDSANNDYKAKTHAEVRAFISFDLAAGVMISPNRS